MPRPRGGRVLSTIVLVLYKGFFTCVKVKVLYSRNVWVGGGGTRPVGTGWGPRPVGVHSGFWFLKYKSVKSTKMSFKSIPATSSQLIDQGLVSVPSFSICHPETFFPSTIMYKIVVEVPSPLSSSFIFISRVCVVIISPIYRKGSPYINISIGLFLCAVGPPHKFASPPTGHGGTRATSARHPPPHCI